TPVADHEALAAPESESDRVGSSDSWILYAAGVAQTLGQNLRDPEDLDPPAPSSSFGQAQISSALQLQTMRSPRTQGSVQRADQHSGRDETAQPILRLPQDRRANLECLWHRAQQGCRPAHPHPLQSTGT